MQEAGTSHSSSFSKPSDQESDESGTQMPRDRKIRKTTHDSTSRDNSRSRSPSRNDDSSPNDRASQSDSQSSSPNNLSNQESDTTPDSTSRDNSTNRSPSRNDDNSPNVSNASIDSNIPQPVTPNPELPRTPGREIDSLHQPYQAEDTRPPISRTPERYRKLRRAIKNSLYIKSLKNRLKLSKKVKV